MRGGRLEAIVREGLFGTDQLPGEDFEDDYVRSGENLLRFGFLLGAGFMMAFAYWDYVVDPAAFPITASLRFFLFGPVLLAGAWFWGRLPGTPYWRGLAGILVAAVGLDVIYFLQGNGYEFSITGNMMVLLFIFVFMRFPFRQVLSICLFVIAVYLAFGLAKVGYAAPLLHIHMMVMLATALMGLLAVYGMQVYAQRVHSLSHELAASRLRIEAMLHDIIPERMVSRLMAGEQAVAEPLDDALFMFVDIVGFTHISQTMPPERLVEILNEFFCEFDVVATRHGWEKIKTIGDGYMAINRWEPPRTPARIVDACIEMFAGAAKVANRFQVPLRIRIGIHYGCAIGGVIGKTRHQYDCWGVAVNLASRLESSAGPGVVNLSESAYALLRDTIPPCPSTEIELKGFGRTTVRVWSPLGN